MRRSLLALALLPVLGLVELTLHSYFAGRAPSFDDYASLGRELSKHKTPGVPVVVAPAWAEPMVRQAAPGAFPIAELTRPDDSAFSGFLEVSLLGARAPELAKHPVESEQRVGPFTLRRHASLHPEPVSFDFVTAVEVGEVEVFTKLGEGLTPCTVATTGHASTGGLHGHVAYPRRRFECLGGRFVGVTLIEDADYRPRRCVLVQAPATGSVLLRFAGVPESRRLVGFHGLSYFLERDDAQVAAQISLREAGQDLGKVAMVGRDGWVRFGKARPAPSRSLEVEVSATRPGVDACVALEAR